MTVLGDHSDSNSQCSYIVDMKVQEEAEFITDTSGADMTTIQHFPELPAPLLTPIRSPSVTTLLEEGEILELPIPTVIITPEPILTVQEAEKELDEGELPRMTACLAQYQIFIFSTCLFLCLLLPLVSASPMLCQTSEGKQFYSLPKPMQCTSKLPDFREKPMQVSVVMYKWNHMQYRSEA